MAAALHVPLQRQNSLSSFDFYVMARKASQMIAQKIGERISHLGYTCKLKEKTDATDNYLLFDIFKKFNFYFHNLYTFFININIK
jgi:hypothetical protein